jgi:hypothetical protein
MIRGFVTPVRIPARTSGIRSALYNRILAVRDARALAGATA